jgi:hypothetical protein
MRTRFFVVAIAIASALAMAGCKQEAKAPEPVRPVLSAVLRPAASDSTVAVGTVQPRYETNLGFRVLGRLIARPVNIGDLVAEGQTVAVIDPTALELVIGGDAPPCAPAKHATDGRVFWGGAAKCVSPSGSDLRFRTTKKSSSYLCGACAEHESGCDATRVSDAPSCHDR